MIKVLYFGSAAFAVPALRHLMLRPDVHEVAGVFSQPDKPVGRKGEIQATPVAAAARHFKLPLFQPKTLKNEDAAALVRKLAPDLIIVAAYGKIIPKAILDIPKLGCLNLHGSVLPKYRGASPIQAAILNGDKEVGVSLMVMDELVDHGPVVATVSVPMPDGITYEKSEKELGALAADVLRAKLDEYVLGSAKPVPQDHSAATFTKILSREDGLIDWKTEDAERIERKIRAYEPWPGVATVWDRAGKKLRLKILAARVVSGGKVRPGTVFSDENGAPAVQAAGSNALELVTVQLEGKTPVGGKQFLSGYKDLLGSSLAG